MGILAAIDAPEAIRKIFDFLGLPSRLPPIAYTGNAGTPH